MCCPDRTHFKPIQYCSRSLTEAGANILGVVVNDVEVANASAFSPATHHHRYGYGYGYGYGSGGSSGRSGDGDNPAQAQDGEKPPSGDPSVSHEEFTDEE